MNFLFEDQKSLQIFNHLIFFLFYSEIEMTIPSHIFKPFLILIIIMVQTQEKFSQVPKSSQIQNQINYLNQKLHSQSFWEKGQNFKFMETWQHMQGIYQSRVHFNNLDRRNTLTVDEFRNNLFKIDDINMFVSSFVLYGLLEAQKLGTIQIDEHKFSMTLEAITRFRDKNTPLGVPQYLFWPQTNINGTWSAKSVNLINVINLSPTFPPSLNNILNKLGLGIFTIVKDIGKYFCIPPDNDDSAVNLALLSALKENDSSHFQFFNSFNFKKLPFYDRVLRYAYRPFESNFSLNQRCDQIDPRTYYVLQPFITAKKQEALQKNQTPSLLLPTTWLLTVDQQVDNAIVIPFETNNVDVSVTANFLFALTYQLLTQQLKLSNLPSDLVQMMHNTVDLIQFVIKKVSKNRLDLVLVYYPSKYDFYWFVSRTLHLLKRYQKKIQEEEFQDLRKIYERLNGLMKNQGTVNILQSSKVPKRIGQNEQPYIYWAEFLGNYGKKQRNDDSLFSTALALNALFDTWTNRKASSIHYDEDTPEQVKQSIQKGIRYLQRQINKQKNTKVGYKMKLDNAFFSGSMKIFKTSFPYFYPANKHYDKKGNDFDPNKMELKDLQFGSKYYVKGYIDHQMYQQMLTKKWFGSDVPSNFNGFNDGVGLTFPYWSSKAISEIMMITSLSKFLRLSEGNPI